MTTNREDISSDRMAERGHDRHKGNSHMPYSTNLQRRVQALESGLLPPERGAVVLLESGESEADGLARYEAAHGPRDGEPFFIRLVGVRPN